MLPKHVCDVITKLTGVKTRSDGPEQVNINHIVSQYPRACDAIEWTLALNSELAPFAGDVRYAEQCFFDIDQQSVFMSPDFNRPKNEGVQRGWLDPTITATLADKHEIENGPGVGEGSFCFLSMSYRWPQYLIDIPPHILDKQYYKKLLNMAPCPDRTIGDALRIFFKSEKDLIAYSGIELPFSDTAVAKNAHNTGIRAGMAVSFQNKSSVPELAVCYGFVREVRGASRDLYLKQVEDVLGIIHSNEGDSEKVSKLSQMIRTFHVDIALCFADHGGWDLGNSKFNFIPDWPTMVRALQHLNPDSGDQFPAPLISVQVLLSTDHLPLGLQWNAMERDQVFQTNLMMDISAEQVISVWRLMPFALHQHGGLLNVGTKDFLSTASDRVVVGHMDFETSESSQVFGTLGRCSEQGLSSPAILNSLHGVSSVHLRILMHRVLPFEAHFALPALARSARLFGVPRGIDVYRVALANSLFTWAKNKARMTNKATADNSIKLSIPGNTIALMLYDLIPWGSSSALNMKTAVSLDEGLLKILLPDFQSAKNLLGRDNGLFDFTSFGYGFVELFAPITVKWEMYDTGRSLVDSRSADGFVAITFDYYEERDRFNDSVIKSTKRHKKARNQQNKRPADCDCD